MSVDQRTEEVERFVAECALDRLFYQVINDDPEEHAVSTPDEAHVVGALTAQTGRFRLVLDVDHPVTQMNVRLDRAVVIHTSVPGLDYLRLLRKLGDLDWWIPTWRYMNYLDEVLDAGESVARAVLPLKGGAEIRASSTPGHHHLYLQRELTEEEMWATLEAFVEAGLVSKRYLEMSRKRGQPHVIVPWQDKIDLRQRQVLHWNDDS